MPLDNVTFPVGAIPARAFDALPNAAERAFAVAVARMARGAGVTDADIAGWSGLFRMEPETGATLAAWLAKVAQRVKRGSTHPATLAAAIADMERVYGPRTAGPFALRIARAVGATWNGGAS